jgi:branched-chain amino acid aminotransferase
MEVFLNGTFVPEDQAVVSVFDRSFLYGDGLFETVRVANGKPFRWNQHVERLREGAKFLNIQIREDDEALNGFVRELIARNRLQEALVRVTLSRGVGVRGYSPRGAKNPFLVISSHPAPEIDIKQPPRWKLSTASIRLPLDQPLAHFKTCNKLAQILARAEADHATADEALLLNSSGSVVEGASSNLFWIMDDVICTAPMLAGILPGISRAVVFEICKTLGYPTRETNTTPAGLRQSQGVFVSLSTVGLAEGISLDGFELPRSPFLSKIWSTYWNVIQHETA